MNYAELQRAKLEAIRGAQNRCQGSARFPDCQAIGGRAHPVTDKPVSLHVIDERLDPLEPLKLRVLCDRCLLAWDFKGHQQADWRRQRAVKNNGELFELNK